jgi:adenylate cyclase class 2
VTYKSKELREGLEVNDELEFGVDSPEVFGEFLGRLGFKPGIAKKKRGRCWKQGDLTAEIAEVEGLGWFIELEILADNSRPETVAEARRRLLDFLREAGVGEDRIEPRYYTEMLREKREREACNPALSSPGEAGKTEQTAPGP